MMKMMIKSLDLKTVANSIVSWMDRNCPSHSNCDKKVGTSGRCRNCCGHSRPFVNGEKKESMNSALTSERSNNSTVLNRDAQALAQP